MLENVGGGGGGGGGGECGPTIPIFFRAETGNTYIYMYNILGLRRVISVRHHILPCMIWGYIIW